jgi:hypothetical protein
MLTWIEIGANAYPFVAFERAVSVELTALLPTAMESSTMF